MFYNFILCVGVYALTYYIYDNLKAPLQIFLLALKKLCCNERHIDLCKRFGKWAVITGATDGIGKAYAQQLAKHGLNVVLISRTKSKLIEVAAEIEHVYRVQTQIIVADFSQGSEIYAHIENELGDKNIGILVNNVGQSIPGMLSSLTAEQVWSLIHTNVSAVSQLSRLFICRMHKYGIHGAIINISSGTELQPLPNAALYAASKAFTRSLTFALQSEAGAYGITVQLVSPGFVRTKINSYLPIIMRGGLLIPDAHTYARYALATLGVIDETTGYFWHGIQTAFMKLFNWRVRAYVANIGFQYLAEGKLKSL